MVRPGFLDKRAKRSMDPCPEKERMEKKKKEKGREMGLDEENSGNEPKEKTQFTR